MKNGKASKWENYQGNVTQFPKREPPPPQVLAEDEIDVLETVDGRALWDTWRYSPAPGTKYVLELDVSAPRHVAYGPNGNSLLGPRTMRRCVFTADSPSHRVPRCHRNAVRTFQAGRVIGGAMPFAILESEKEEEGEVEFDEMVLRNATATPKVPWNPPPPAKVEKTPAELSAPMTPDALDAWAMEHADE
jgi:hypothetical protein